MTKKHTPKVSINRYYKVEYKLKKALTTLKVKYDEAGKIKETGTIERPLSKNARLVCLSLGFFINNQNSNTTDFAVSELTAITGLGRTAIIQALKELRQVGLIKEDSPTLTTGIKKQYQIQYLYNGLAEKPVKTGYTIKLTNPKITASTTLTGSPHELVTRSPGEPVISLLYKQDNSKKNYPLLKQKKGNGSSSFFNFFFNLESWKKELAQKYLKNQIESGIDIYCQSKYLEKIITNNEYFDTWQELKLKIQETEDQKKELDAKKQNAQNLMSNIFAAIQQQEQVALKGL